MKINKRKILCMALAAAMTVQTAPMVFAENDISAYSETAASGDYGTVRWTFDKNNGILYVNGKGEIADAKYGGTVPTYLPWSEFSSEIKRISIGEGITRIGNYTFGSDFGADTCSSVTSISLPTTLKEIGEGAFMYVGSPEFGQSNGIENITLPKNVNKIAGGAFYGSGIKYRL